MLLVRADVERVALYCADKIELDNSAHTESMRLNNTTLISRCQEEQKRSETCSDTESEWMKSTHD